MFWQSLQVTFEIFCSHVAQVGTCVFLHKTLQINGHFGYITTELIEQKDHLWCLWDILECQQKKLVKGKAWIPFLFLRFVSHLQGCWNMFSLFVYYPQIIALFAFAEKPFWNLTCWLAGFTTHVALICYLTCVISWRLDFYSNLFEFGALHFHWLLARYRPSYPREGN